jgi:hypothetical protein
VRRAAILRQFVLIVSFVLLTVRLACAAQILLSGNSDNGFPPSDPTDVSTDGDAAINQFKLPSTAGFPTEPNVAINDGAEITFTGFALGAGVYNTTNDSLESWCPPLYSSSSPALGVGNYCYGGGSGSNSGGWWNVSPSGSDFSDARILWDYHDARWIYTSVGTATNSNIEIAVSSDNRPRTSAALWHQYSIPNGCPSGQTSDFPKTGINANWLLIVLNCSISGNVAEGTLHAIELPSIISGGTPIDHVLACPSGCPNRLPNWTGGGRSQNHDTPVIDESGQDNTGYTVAFRDIGAIDAPPPGYVNPTSKAYAISVCTITGPVSAPVYHANHCYWGARGSLSGSGFNVHVAQDIEPIPDGSSKFTVGCRNYQDGGTMAREDFWANGHLVITAAAGMAYGGNYLTSVCGSEFNAPNNGNKGSMITYYAWDTTTLAQERLGLVAADDVFGAADGSSERAYPQVDHVILNGADYVVLTYTQADTSGLTPTMYATTFHPVLQFGPNAFFPTGGTKLHKYKIFSSTTGAGTIHNGRWGDYSGAWHRASHFWISGMLYLGGNTPQTGYVADVFP